MRNLLLLIFLLVFQSGQSKPPKCKKMHTGKFELKDSKSNSVSIIERNDSLQIETDESLHVKTSYEVKWINDCTYELHNRNILEGELPFNGSSTDVIKIEIVKVEGNQVFIKITSNYSDFVAETVMTKIN